MRAKMNIKDINKLLDDQERHRQLSGDHFDRMNNPADEGVRNFQREMDRPDRAARQAKEAIQNELNRPTNGAFKAMRLLQEENGHTGLHSNLFAKCRNT